MLKTGDANQRILGIDFEQGQIALERNGLPRMTVILDQAKKPMPGLASLRVLNDTYTRIQKEIVRVTEEIEKVVQQEKELTEQLGDGKVAGPTFRSGSAATGRKESLDEQDYLQPLLYNSMVEQRSLEDRQKVLEDSVKQLQQVSVAKQP